MCSVIGIYGNVLNFKNENDQGKIILNGYILYCMVNNSVMHIRNIQRDKESRVSFTNMALI